MKSTIKLVSLCLFILLQGCSKPMPVSQQSAKIVWKSPSFRYADMGFIADDRKSIKVEIYGVGMALMRLYISEEKICMNKFQCISKKEFNTRYLSRYYPDTILENIFRAKAIYKGKNFIKNRNGFTQILQKENQYAIEYKVFNRQIIFRDTINEILIKVIKQ